MTLASGLRVGNPQLEDSVMGTISGWQWLIVLTVWLSLLALAVWGIWFIIKRALLSALRQWDRERGAQPKG